MTHQVAEHEPTTVSDPAAGEGSRAGIDLQWLNDRVEYGLYQDCVHCGLCTASCPTYVMTGDENDSPRGRIYLMRAVVDGRAAVTEKVRHHLGLCLDCRACETACPSGVQYGKLVEPFKVAMEISADGDDRPPLLLRILLRHLFPYANRLKWALIPARIGMKTGLIPVARSLGLTKLLPKTLQRMEEMLPPSMPLLPPAPLPEKLAPVGAKRATVALFTGCVTDAMSPETNAATARVLQHNGCEVHVVRGQACCGAVSYHSGDESGAKSFMRTNLNAFDLSKFDAVIVNAAGCGAMLKDYAHLMHHDPEAARAAAFTARVKDVSEFLVELGPVKPANRIDTKLTYHDACHLCHGQQIRNQPRQLLGMIDGVSVVPLDETEICCGAAGTYNFAQPEMSRQLGQRKAEYVDATGAPVVAVANIGCQMQIRKYLADRGGSQEVVHPIELLDKAYGPLPGDSA
jgi:glycolate oxidase iron-sulfur subunit